MYASAFANSPGEIDWEKVSEKTKMALYDAQQEMAKNNYRKAIDLLHKFQAKRPEHNHFLLDFNIGTAYGFLGDTDKAIEHLEKAAALEKNYAPLLLNLGKLYYQKKDFAKAATAVEQGFALSPQKDPEVLFMAMAGYFQANNLDKTIELGRDLLFNYRFEKNDVVGILASAYITKGNLPEAISMIKKITERDPGNDTYWKLIAQAYFKNQQYRDATVAYEIYGHLKDLSRDEVMIMGDLFTMIGLPLRAAQYYEEALRNGGTAEEFDKLSIAYYCAYEFDRAIKTVDKALAVNAGTERLLLKAQLYYVQDNYAEAQNLYMQAAQNMSRDGHEWLMAGYCAMRKGNVQMARDLLRKASEYPAQRQDALAMIKSLSSGEEINKAMQEFKQAYTL
jgi:tetratricopeptide (TPR) repeat protein